MKPMQAKYRFEISIDTDNDAFKPNLFGELSRILGELSTGMESGFVPTKLKDINGNTVGTAKLVQSNSWGAPFCEG